MYQEIENTPKLILSIKSRYTELNPAMKRVADYFIENCQEAVHMSINEIAAGSKVSIGSVTRFVKLFDFKNFRAFQLGLAGESQYHYAANKEEQGGIKDLRQLEYGGAVPSDSMAEICKKIVSSNIQMMRDSLEIMDFDILQTVAEQILKVRNLIFLGVGRSHITAQSGQSRFYRLGINTFCYSDAHEETVATSLVGKEDVVIGISNYGRSASVVRGIERARKLGAVTVGITSADDSPLAKAAENLILTAFNYDSVNWQKKRGVYEPASESIAQIAVLDCIYMYVALRQSEECIEKYYKTVEELESERI